MSSHRPSRFLAPLALLAAVAAVLIVVTGSTSDGESESDSGPRSEERRETRTGRTSTEDERAETSARTSTTPKRKTYTVQAGDTLASISERTGVSVEELQELNPTIDANSLTVGQKIKLTE